MNEKKITGFGPCEKLRCVWRPVMFSYSEISISNKYFVVNQKFSQIRINNVFNFNKKKTFWFCDFVEIEIEKKRFKLLVINNWMIIA